jgi:hypothetical protein
MVLKNLFGGGPLSEKKIEKITKLVCNPYCQPDVRKREMCRLLDDEQPAALQAVLKRFAFNSNGGIADEDEKKWLENQMVDMGKLAIEPLELYIRTGKQLTYALRAYHRLQGPEKSADFFLTVLRGHGPDAYRAIEAKLQIVWQLAEYLESEGVIAGLEPFVEDHSDDIRWAVMDLLEKVADAGTLKSEVQQAYAAKMGTLLADDSAGPRIQRRAAEVLADRGWQVDSAAKTVAPVLADEFFIDKKYYVRRRSKPKS